MNILVGKGDGDDDDGGDGDDGVVDDGDDDGAGDIPLRSDAPFAFDCTLWQVAPLPTDPSSKFSVMFLHHDHDHDCENYGGNGV